MILGIDPGLDGCLCFLDGDGGVASLDMPTFNLERAGKNKREIAPHLLIAAIRGKGVTHAFIEKAGVMPPRANRHSGEQKPGAGQGVSSAFASGKGYGIILGILAALQIPVTEVPPATWKRRLEVPKAKDAARARASQLMPACAYLWPLKKHDGRAESALIALYGRRQLQQ